MAISTGYVRSHALIDHRHEVKTAKKYLKEGRATISAEVAGKELARGRKEIPTEEYLTYWTERLRALNNGADVKTYRY